MINPPLHYYSIHRDAHPAVQSLPAQFYLDYLTNHVLKISERFSCNKISARAVEPVNGYLIFLSGLNCAGFIQESQTGLGHKAYGIRESARIHFFS